MHDFCQACGYARDLHNADTHEFVSAVTDILLANPAATTKLIEEVVFPTRKDAEKVLDELGAIIDQYGQATISDLYDLIGIMGNFEDNKFGWTNIQGTTIRRVLGGHVLNFPLNVRVDQEVPVKAEPETSDLERELASVLNKHSAENASNTPDFILAEYLMACLTAFNAANNKCREWQGQGFLNG